MGVSKYPLSILRAIIFVPHPPEGDVVFQRPRRVLSVCRLPLPVGLLGGQAVGGDRGGQRVRRADRQRRQDAVQEVRVCNAITSP